ncbi:MAG: cell division protein FtsA [Candidatus Wildermuthbacteria bacterium RIFCSPLOWO2_01_FULL_47_18]|uniref:Cell division protein FtsA n=2 Tax=Candidatus Wildermuthiibacteriota TaxID=1817923 RepID=A0A1G2RK65_9BACT|nr:MAG: cell division protein FtsA [Candidatus Wildermuthbacteria bacterium RIFCSPHIGHO2_02_FULL_48_16]OHA73243.1 MAG: cell division protein FtsA [Candidatus Wildermuthbacteria bacterium RIFCSPLOWO2_01_FULL_47_18]
MNSQAVVALDIGTHTIKMGVAKRKEGGEVEVLGLVQEPSSGVRKGSCVNPEETALKILAAKQRLENLSSQRIRAVIVNIGGSHIFSTTSHGIVAVSRADGHISQEDVERVVSAAGVFPLKSNNEILESFPQKFIVDGENTTKEVVGMKGMRLEADILAVCAFSPYLKNLTDAVFGADIEILDIVPSPLMGAWSVLTPRQKELGVALIDLGAGTTNLAVFEEGELIHASVFPVGSGNITSDIAIGLRTEHDTAERIKKEFGSLGKTSGKRKERFESSEGEILNFSPKGLSRIIEMRVKELFQFIGKELKSIERQGSLPSGVVLTGGGAKLPGIAEFAKKELKLPAKLGSPHEIVTFETDPAFFGVMGLASRVLQEGEQTISSLPGASVAQKLKKIFRVFIP